MKYCINYYKDFRYLNEINEIIFTPKDINENFIKYVEDNFKQEQRIIVSLVNAGDLASMMPLIDKLRSIHSNYAIIIKLTQYDANLLSGHTFFFGEYCKTYDQVATFIAMGVSDVYIVETLAFSLRDIGNYAHEYDVNVRVLPNVAQSTLGSISRLPQECKFFIRPEDVDVYEPYVDVFELFGDVSRLSVTYEVYNEKQWQGPISYIVKGLDDMFSLDAATPFGEQRLSCGQKCYKCEYCTRQVEINKIADKYKLKIKKAENNDVNNS